MSDDGTITCPHCGTEFTKPLTRNYNTSLETETETQDKTFSSRSARRLMMRRDETEINVSKTSKTRRLAPAEQFALHLLEERFLPVFRSGRGYDATLEFARSWRDGWDRVALAGYNPVSFGVTLMGAYAELSGMEPDYPMLGRLVGRYGIYGLVGFEAATSRDLTKHWYAYASTVAKQKSLEAEAEGTDG